MKIKGLIFLEAKMSKETLENVLSKTSIINTNKLCRKEEADIMLTKPDDFHHQACLFAKAKEGRSQIVLQESSDSDAFNLSSNLAIKSAFIFSINRASIVPSSLVFFNSVNSIYISKSL